MKQARTRTTVYAAFTIGDGVSIEPIANVFDFDRSKLEAVLADRKASNKGLPGEHIVQCTVAFYRRKLEARGLPIPARLEAPSEEISVSLSRDDLSHLLYALDVSIADIQERMAVEPDPAASPGPALVELNQGLRARLAAFLTASS